VRERRRQRGTMEGATLELRHPFPHGRVLQMTMEARVLWLCLPPAPQVSITVLVMISSSITGATNRHHRSTAPPDLSLSYDMANRSRVTWESRRTVLVHSALLETCVSRYSWWQPLVRLRCPHPLLVLGAWSGAHHPCSWQLGAGGGPAGAHARGRPRGPPGRVGWFRSQGVGRDRTHAPGVK
jgi:hypothetical protein